MHFNHAGWAPHVYFHMLAERNVSHTSTRRARRQETGTTTLSDIEKETVGSSSPNSNLIVEAMEAGRKY